MCGISMERRLSVLHTTGSQFLGCEYSDPIEKGSDWGFKLWALHYISHDAVLCGTSRIFRGFLWLRWQRTDLQPAYGNQAHCLETELMCGTPPAVDNTYLVGRRRSHYDIHAVVQYQCADGFFQRHIPTVRCRPNGTWERPKIICTKSRRSHHYRRQHHRSRREHRRHRRHGSGHRGRD
ncbi:neurocan core protein-like [Sinocyclocheilus grahami]|uniref:neurocan core protein-like n=1 Tax=Sinocyclocheilus grahami TaxID=75366 RepID=UPI0007AD34F8|nr:PREDICTED: neurocan core protein-like [Sinocyclocheilus grahami]